MLSIVIPYFNESQCIGPLLERLHRSLSTLENYEIVIIDNGSRPSESAALRSLSDSPKERIIQLSRNFGYQGALWAGLDQAKGDPVVFMDADGEDPPEVIPQFLEQWRKGYDVVYGIRRRREVNPLTHLFYKIFYRLLAFFSEVVVPLDAGEFSLVSGQALQALRQFKDRTRLMRYLRAWVGFRQIGVIYDRKKRLAGQSKFRFSSAVSLAWEGFISGTDLPVRVSLSCALACIVVCALGCVYYIFWYFYGREKIPGFASLNITLLFLFSMVFFCVYLLATYVMKILAEIRQRPPYLIVEGLRSQTEKTMELL